MAAVKYERIVQEDLNIGTGTVDVSMPGGGTQVGHQIGAHSFPAEVFIATMDGGQSIPSGVVTTVILDDEEVDSVGWYEPLTSAFTPTIAGRYVVAAYLRMGALTGTVTVGIYKNTSELVGEDKVAAAVGVRFVLAAIVDMNGGSDQLTLRVSHNAGSPFNVDAARFSAALIGKVVE